MSRFAPHTQGWRLAVAAGIAAAIALLALHAPSVAQAQACIDPTTGLECTPMPPSCGLPGLPDCPPPNQEPEPTRPRPTARPTATATASPTVTSTPTTTPTLTATLPPSPTPTVTPTAKPVPPIIDLFGETIAIFNPSPKTIELIPSWMAPPNIEVEAAEVTQAIQCLHNLECADNSVLLYTDKPTMVRVYLRLNAGPNNYEPGIGGALCPGSTGLQGCANPLRPINVTWAKMIPDPVSEYRTDLRGTLNFLLPPDWLYKPTTLAFTVYVNYKGENLPSEYYFKDNLRYVEVGVEPSQPLAVMFAVIQDHGITSDPKSEWPILAYLRGIYPTGDVRPWIGAQLLGKTYPYSTPQGNCGKGYNDILDDLWWIRSGYPEVYYGMVATESMNQDPGTTAGCAKLGEKVAAGMVLPTHYVSSQPLIPVVAGHEIGHALGRPHSPGCGAKDPDPNYPRANGRLDEVGVNVTRGWVYPTTDSDYMGYCSSQEDSAWTSMYTYAQVAQELPAGVAAMGRPRLAAPVPAGPVLVASGDASPEGIILTAGFFRLDSASAPAPSSNDGPYSVELVDAAGKVLTQRSFRPATSDGTQGPEPASSELTQEAAAGRFNLVLPAPDGVAAIVFKYEGVEIGGTKVSRRAPTVGWVAPADGEAWGTSGMHSLSWQASDPDGDPLQYLVQFTRDGGATWQTIAAGLADPELVVDAGLLPGVDRSAFRVLASDGFYTSEATSPTLSVERKPPVVHLYPPEYDLSEGAPVLLQAVATDLEDGPLPASSLSWTADGSQRLGDTSTILVPSLAEGSHEITVTAVDQDGQIAQDTVTLVVGPAYPVLLPQRRGGSPLACLAGGIVVGAGAFIAAFVLRRRWRGRKAKASSAG